MSTFEINFALQVLKKYALYYLIPSKSKHLGNLTDSLEKLTRSNSASVVVNVLDIFIDLNLEEKVKAYNKSLLRFLNMSSETKFIVLLMIEKIAKRFPTFLQNHFNHFFIISLEKTTKKIDILELIINKVNESKIIEELVYYTRSSSKKIVIKAIQTLGNLQSITERNSQTISKTLIKLLKSPESFIVDQAVSSLIKVIVRDLRANMTILISCIKIAPTIKDSKAKSSIISLLCEISNIAPSLVAEFLRKTIREFKSETPEVKIQVMNLVSECASNSIGNELFDVLCQFLVYIVLVSLYDENAEVRSKAAFLKNVLFINCKREVEKFSDFKVEDAKESLKLMRDNNIVFKNSFLSNFSQKNESDNKSNCTQNPVNFLIYQFPDISETFKIEEKYINSENTDVLRTTTLEKSPMDPLTEDNHSSVIKPESFIAKKAKEEEEQKEKEELKEEVKEDDGKLQEIDKMVEEFMNLD